MSYGDYSDYLYGSGYGALRAMADIPAVLAISGIIFLIIGIVLMAVFLPAKKSMQYQGFTKSLYNFLNFNSFWISPVMKVFYIATAGALLITGFYVMFALSFIAGLVILIFSVVIRIFFELTLILVSIRDQVAQVNRNLERMSPNAPQSPYQQPQSPYQQPQNPYQQPQQPTAAPGGKVCPSCGAPCPDGNAFCEKCGKPL